MTPNSISTRLLCSALALVAALALGVGCSNGKSDEQKAADKVEAGLDAHVEGKTDEALKLYEEALALDPNNKLAAYNLGLIKQLAGDAAAAERYYRMALTVDPGFAPALYNLAIVVTPTNPTEAEQLYRRAIAADPTAAAPHRNLGFLLQAQGREEEAQQEFALANQLDPQGAPSTTAPPAQPAETTTTAKR